VEPGVGKKKQGNVWGTRLQTRGGESKSDAVTFRDTRKGDRQPLGRRGKQGRAPLTGYSRTKC